jgi:PAS domain S-box-containing protein
MSLTSQSPAQDFLWTPVHDHQLHTLQVAELYRFAPVMAASSYFGALLTLAVFFDDKQLGTGLYWFAYATAILLYRIAVIVAYEHRRKQAPSHWANLAVVGNLMAGIQWGLLGTLLFPIDHGYREIFAVMVITSYVGGSITAYASVKWAHPALSIPAAVPAAVYLFFFHDGMHAAAGCAALFLVGATVYFAFKEHRSIEQRLRLQIQHGELVEQVHASNVRLTAENRNLAHRAAMRLKRARSAQTRANMLGLHYARNPLPMLECDMRYRVLGLNEAAERVLGYRQNDLEGLSMLELLLTDSAHSNDREMFTDFVDTHTPGSLNTELKTCAGDIFSATLHVTPIYSEDGSASRVAIIVTDIKRNGDMRRAA